MIMVREATIDKIESMCRLIIESAESDPHEDARAILTDLKAAKGGYGPHGPRQT